MADLHEIQLADGTTLKTALPPSRLAELGLPPGPSLGERGALAFGVQPTDGGISQIPGLGQALGTGQAPKRSDVPTLDLGAASTVPVESAESVAASDKTAAQTIDKSREGKERAPGVARFGAETKSIAPEAGAAQPSYEPPRPRFATIRAKDIKGADIRTGYSKESTGGTEHIPEWQEQSADARINQKLAMQEQGDARKDALEVERGAAAEEEIRRQVQEQQIRDRQAAIQQKIAQAEAEQAQLDQEHDQIRQAKVNPNEYWDSLGTGGKVMAAIGMIANGINSGINGGPNQTAEFIYRAIRDNVADQRERLEARRQGFNVRQTRLEKKAALLGGSLELAAQELEANDKAMAAAMMRKHAADAGIASVNPELMAAAAKLDAEAADQLMAVRAQNGERVKESFAFTPDRTVQVGGGAPLKPEQRERLVTFGGGNRRGYVVAGNARDKVQTAVTGYENLSAGLAQLRALAAQASTGNLDAQRAYNSLRSALLTEANVMRGQGAMSEGDQKNNEAGMPDVASLTTTRNEAETKLREQEAWANARLRSTIRDNVYQDPDATTPAAAGDSGGLRRE